MLRIIIGRYCAELVNFITLLFSSYYYKGIKVEFDRINANPSLSFYHLEPFSLKHSIDSPIYEYSLHILQRNRLPRNEQPSFKKLGNDFKY